MARVDVAREIVELIGQDAAIMRRAGSGWPSKIDIISGGQLRPVSLHVSRASSHARQPWEWRFQNPAGRDPVQANADELPILVGLDRVEDRPVLIAVDGTSRLGRDARFSILYNKRISREAASAGWSEQTNTSGDQIFALRPQLFPLLVDLLQQGIPVPTQAIVDAAATSGAIDDPSEAAKERVRRQVTAFVRDQRFGRDVRAAYDNKCAMCRVGLSLVAGAHIYPVQAPGSPDSVWNGIALCHNHHAAFDNHALWVSPDYEIRIKPALAREATASVESARFLDQTRAQLWVPAAAEARPRLEMLQRRYEYYDEEYSWAPNF